MPDNITNPLENGASWGSAWQTAELRAWLFVKRKQGQLFVETKAGTVSCLIPLDSGPRSPAFTEEGGGGGQ